MIIYLTIFMKQYLLKFCGKGPIDENAAKQISSVLMKKLKVIQFGLGMMQIGDLHILQVVWSLETIIKYGQEILEEAKCFNDFKAIVDLIKSDFQQQKYTQLVENQQENPHIPICNFE